MVAERTASRADGAIVGMIRMFAGDCPEHGPFHAPQPAHHSTVIEKVWNSDLSDVERRRICDGIDGDELRRFKLARKGRLHATEEEIERWMTLAGRVRATR